MFQLVILLLVLIFIKVLLPEINKLLSYLVSSFLSVLFVIQLSSVVLTGEIANYRFYENFNFEDVLSVSEFFGKEGILLFVALIAVILLIEFGSRFLRKKSQKNSLKIAFVLVGIIILSFPGGIINNAYSTARLKFSKQVTINVALEALNIGIKEYVIPENIKAAAGKNIIVLSLESFEKAYLSDKLHHLTPNLRGLAKKHSFYTMNQTPAGGWTSASLYTGLTGIPAFFKGDGNSVFQNNYEHKITTLAHVLKVAGYDLEYFIGKKEYAGINDMLTSMDFVVKSEKDFIPSYSNVPWGMQDKDLFEEFKKELLQKKNAKKPFAMFLSTISTHFPDGVPDKRIDSILPPQRSRLELMASATDFFVGDLIRFLENEGFLSNTVFYIYPDHLLMGDNATVIQDFDERGLFFLTNAKISNSDMESEFYQIDIPKLILEGAKVDHNAKFLTDFITTKDKIAFLNKNKTKLLQLNDASLKTLDCSQGIYVELQSDKNVVEIKNDLGLVLLAQELPIAGNCLRIFFDDKWRIKEHFNIPFDELVNPPNKTSYYLDLFKSDGMLYGSLKGTYHFGITKKAEQEVDFNTRDFALLKNITLSGNGKDNMVLKSNSWHAKKPSSFSINGVTHNISRGLTVMLFNTVSPNQFEQKTFDTYESEDDAKEFVQLAKVLKDDKLPYVIIAHDAASKSLEPYVAELKELGLEKLSTLPGRHAYIAYSLNGKNEEFIDKTSITQTASFPKNHKHTKEYFKDEPIPFVSHNNRFIAHAGGELDGIKYTNSKEALDASYEKGFRLFELDIEKTRDGAFVATHDWKHWVKQTGFTGEVPVTRKEFLKHKIYGKYTPLDMEGMNNWFQKHLDAILVTDKVNEPVAFANGFVDKKRLRMELFTTEAIEKASKNNIESMVSGKPLSEIKGDPMTYFKEHKLKYVAISRRNIAAKKELLRKFRENDIKVYVYHVNFDSAKDEGFVLQNEIGIVYGMYADKWIADFEK